MMILTWFLKLEIYKSLLMFNVYVLKFLVTIAHLKTIYFSAESSHEK